MSAAASDDALPVVPPSDINRTKPLIRLILNQVGRRLTEDLTGRRPDAIACS